MGFQAISVSWPAQRATGSGRLAQPRARTVCVNSTTLRALVFAAGRDSGRVPLRTRAKNWPWITCTRADAESARAAASSTPHAAAPARTIGRWGPHGPRWAAESAEMAQFLMSEAPHPQKTAPGAVSRARLHIARNEREKCAISATLSVPPFGMTHVELRWPWGGRFGVGVVTRAPRVVERALVKRQSSRGRAHRGRRLSGSVSAVTWPPWARFACATSTTHHGAPRARTRTLQPRG